MLSACATLVNGTSQTVTVSTVPTGAACTLDRVGTRVGAISATPGSVRLDKSKNDLSVTCSKEDFQTATVARSPSCNGATFGNIIAGGVIGVAVDAAPGANFSYPDDIRLDMAANPAPVLPPMAMQAPAFVPDEAVPFTPVATRSVRQPARIRPTNISATTGVGPAGLYPR